MAKIDLDRFTEVALNQKAASMFAAVLGLSEEGQAAEVNQPETLDLLAVMTAALIEADTTLNTRSDLRKEVEAFGNTVLHLVDFYRQGHAKDGQHFIQRLGGTYTDPRN